MRRSRFLFFPIFAWLLVGCAALSPPKPGASATGSGLVAGTPPVRGDPAAPKPFDEVVAGATVQPGWLPVWRKAERFWLELPPELLLPEAPLMLMTANVSSTVGERGLYAGWMGPRWLVSFRKLAGLQIQLVAHNTRYAADNAPLKRAVQDGFSNSLLASMAVVSAPHPQRKSVLVDASFLVSDFMSYSTSLEQAFRVSYNLDRNNSFIENARTTDEQASLSLRLHFSAPRLPSPSNPHSAPRASPPNTPDPRSIFVGTVINFRKLPPQPMRPRLGDTRLGHFADEVTDLSDDRKPKPQQMFINRWRLEKQEPQAPLSPPRQPIVYWLDKNIPHRYRAAVTAGILEWNKAFADIGFLNAIEVRQQADDADWSTLDARHASVRWYVGADANVAVGPHHSDPRSGEILDADIAMGDIFGRSARRLLDEEGVTVTLPAVPAWRGAASMVCEHSRLAAAEMGFAMDMIEARGEDLDTSQTEAYVQAVVKDVITHEVGHTLGLRHNFKGSTAYSPAQLQDKAFTAAKGISASVMDYNGVNLSLFLEPPSTLVQTGLGVYDRWAIEFAYRPLDPHEEAAALAKIASRSAEPGLAFADDIDAGWGTGGMDPLANRFDLGSDPLVFWTRRLQLAQELWQRVQERVVLPGDDLTRQRRVLLRGFTRLTSAADLASKYVGGVVTTRAAQAGSAAYVPVPASQQRAALKLITQGFFNADSFRFKPEFLATAITDHDEPDRGGPLSIPAAVLRLQVAALERMYSPATATRLLEASLYAPVGSDEPMTLSEVYLSLQKSIWSELESSQEIPSLRRNLQREHLQRLQRALVRDALGSQLPPDAVSLLRWHALDLQRSLQSAVKRATLSVSTRAHLQDSLSQLSAALQASMQRAS